MSYKHDIVKFDTGTMTSVLDARSVDGWELITTTGDGEYGIFRKSIDPMDKFIGSGVEQIISDMQKPMYELLTKKYDYDMSESEWGIISSHDWSHIYRMRDCVIFVDYTSNSFLKCVDGIVRFTTLQHDAILCGINYTKLLIEACISPLFK